MLSFFKRLVSSDKVFLNRIRSITGSTPGNLTVYKLALRHSSSNDPNSTSFRLNNERLEFLGDSVMDLIIAEYLFQKFPTRDEGFMTETKSKLVNRDHLGELARKIGLNKMIEFVRDNRYSGNSFKFLFGDAMEAFIAAVFLDKGYPFTKKFVINKLLTPFVDIDKLISLNKNFKSKLLEWGQKEKKQIQYNVIEQKGKGQNKIFVVKVLINNEFMGEGTFSNKKQAEQNAAEQACIKLNLKAPIPDF